MTSEKPHSQAMQAALKDVAASDGKVLPVFTEIMDESGCSSGAGVTTTQHTPGPWQVQEAWDLGINDPESKIIGFDVSTDDGRGNGYPIPYTEANARLIAAAPETARERNELIVQLKTEETTAQYHYEQWVKAEKQRRELSAERDALKEKLEYIRGRLEIRVKECNEYLARATAADTKCGELLALVKRFAAALGTDEVLHGGERVGLTDRAIINGPQLNGCLIDAKAAIANAEAR